MKASSRVIPSHVSDWGLGQEMRFYAILLAFATCPGEGVLRVQGREAEG